MRRPSELVVESSGRNVLETWARSRTLPQRIVVRSRIVLLCAAGNSSRVVAAQLNVSRNTVELWRTRFIEGGVDALTTEKPGRGRKPRKL